MSEDFKKWSQQLSEAAEHAVKVYETEIDKLQKRVAEADNREEREIERVAKQVDRDIRYAEHHIAYLEKIVEKELERVAVANDRLETRVADGESEKSIAHAASNVAKVEASAEKHVERTFERVIVDIERDAKAAARHIVNGLELLDEYEEDLGDEATAAAERVAAALDKVNKKLNS